MKKILCFILTTCIALGLCGCPRQLDAVFYGQFKDRPRSTVWVSEDQKIQLYSFTEYGSILNNSGELIPIYLNSYCTATDHTGAGSAYINDCITDFVSDPDPEPFPSDSDENKLFDFFDATVEPNGVFHMKINWCDTNGSFDESVTALTFYPKASSETGFFKDLSLSSEEPKLSFELNENYGRYAVTGYLAAKYGINVKLEGDIIPYTTADGFGAAVYFYDAAPYIDQKPIIKGILEMKNGSCVFRIHDSYIGKVFAENIPEFEMKPVTVAQEVSPE